jgi:hypothetical protein
MMSTLLLRNSKQRAEKRDTEFASELDDALHLGSSGLEILEQRAKEAKKAKGSVLTIDTDDRLG